MDINNLQLDQRPDQKYLKKIQSVQKYRDYVEEDLSKIIDEFRKLILEDKIHDDDLLGFIDKLKWIPHFINGSIFNDSFVAYNYFLCYNSIVDFYKKYPRIEYQELCDLVKGNCCKIYFELEGHRLEDENKFPLEEELILTHQIISFDTKRKKRKLADFDKLLLAHLKNKLTHLQTKPEWGYGALISAILTCALYAPYYIHQTYIECVSLKFMKDMYLPLIQIFASFTLAISLLKDVKQLKKLKHSFINKCRVYISRIKYYSVLICRDYI